MSDLSLLKVQFGNVFIQIPTDTTDHFDLVIAFLQFFKKELLKKAEKKEPQE